jgi:hypothetical protein
VHVRRPLTAVCAALALVLAGCGNGADLPAGLRTADSHATSHASSPSAAATRAAAKDVPLRDGERFQSIRLRAAYTPKAPTGTGTDDYRCFVLDPHLDEDAFITGLNILPGTPAEVHHVILFRAPPEMVPAVQDKDAAEDGEGWTCFGGTGVDRGGALDDAPWLGAWAPGGSEQMMAKDVGVPLEKGSRVIMQVHYNLLSGRTPDVSAAQLRVAPGTKKLDPLRTMLLPAPVEMPCRPQHAGGPLCDRAASLVDVRRRFGSDVGMLADYLHLLCGRIEAGVTQTCDRTLNQPATLRAVAGHMHLLGRSIKVEVNPDGPDARTVLDIPTWDFDDQGARPVRPVDLAAGDTVRVTCRHDQRLRDQLPAFEGQPDKYVLWGEGTTDEMCLGILLVTGP